MKNLKIKPSRLARIPFALALTLGGAAYANLTIATETAEAATCGVHGSSSVIFFSLRPWYSGLIGSDGELCQPIASDGNAALSGDEIKMQSFIWLIVFNVMDMLLTLIGYAAVLFVLIGGFHVLFSGGDPGKVSRGKTTISNALMGVVIAMVASSGVRFVNETLIGSTPLRLTISSGGSVTSGGTAPSTTNMWGNATSNFLYMMGIAALAMVVWGGVKLSVSNGNPQAQAKAKNTIIFAIVGMIIMMIAGTIVKIIFNAVDSGKVD